MLFAEDEYVERVFEVDVPEGITLPDVKDKLQLRLYGWPMGSSGAICWRGAWASVHLLLRAAATLPQRRVLELGAGCGLLAHTAALLGAESTASDGSEDEVPLLEKNADAFIDRMGLGGSLAAAHLEWGLAHAEESALSERSFDLIVGSEIVYIPEYIPALAESIAYLLADDGEAVIVNTAVATRTTQSEARQLL
ncbi:CaMKMT, partial [Symbiodinium sp. CCMP2592]